MRMLVTVSDQVWGGKHQYMIDAITGLLADGHDVRAVVERGGQMAARLARRGMPHDTVAPFAADSDAAVEVLEQLLDAPGPIDILCVSGRHDAAVARRALTCVANAPMVVFYRHSAFPLDDSGHARELLQRANLIIGTSHEQVARQFADRAGLRGDVIVITSSVDRKFIDQVAKVDAQAVRARLGIGEDAFVFTVPARLSWEKGIGRVIQAMPKVGDLADEVVLLIVGDGPELPKLRKQIAELNLADRVRLTGQCDDMAPVLAATDAVVLASTVPETGPLALKEAMGAGKPVIAPRIGGITEFVEHGISGLLFSDDDGLAEAMNELATDPARAGLIGRMAQRTIFGGHLQEHRRPWLCQSLDRQAIRSSPLDVVLAELRWADVRWRDEAEGGFVFVPATSQIAELKHADYEFVKAALVAGKCDSFAELPGQQARSLVELLFNMGALVQDRQRRAE